MSQLVIKMSLALLVLSAAAACQKAPVDTDRPDVEGLRQRFTLAEEPDGAIGVLALREQLVEKNNDVSNGGAENTTVSVVGKIGGTPNPWGAAEPNYPWVDGEARFFLADLDASNEVSAHTHTHEDGEPCPFCANAARSDTIVVVRFLDDDGKHVSVPANELLAIREGQTVVVHGEASAKGQGKDAVVIVAADGVFVRD